jgi:hypothetical protein
MNRHDRRAHVAKSRRRPGYVHRLQAIAQEAGAGTVSHILVHHAPECAIYTNRGECTCTPDISIHPDGGRTVIVIDEDGTTEEVATS